MISLHACLCDTAEQEWSVKIRSIIANQTALTWLPLLSLICVINNLLSAADQFIHNNLDEMLGAMGAAAHPFSR